jgi:hypothetical protein
MTKSFLVIAACLLAASAASAQVQNATPGSSGSNNVGATLNPAPTPAPAPAADISATSNQKIQNATPGSSGSNNVAATLNPAPTPAPAPAASATANGNARMGQGMAPGTSMQAQAGAQAQTFNPGMYTSASDCLTAAAAANAALSQCSSVKAK